MDTCLHLATRRKDGELVKLFIENGANVDGVNRDGQTILHIASLNGDQHIIRCVLNFRDLWIIFNSTIFVITPVYTTGVCLRPGQILLSKTTTTARPFIWPRRGVTRQLWSFWRKNSRYYFLTCHVDELQNEKKSFIIPKASVFDRSKDGSTLMHLAALHGHSETAMVLFKKGVPLLMPNRYSMSSIRLVFLF